MIQNFAQSIKLFFLPKKKKFYGLLFHLLGFYPSNHKLYELAFIHKSAGIVENGYNKNNERLEYLGDAILGAIIADILYKYFPNKDEGFLTQIRSKIVSRESLNKLALKLNLQKHVKERVNHQRHKYIYGDAVEALIGAIYLDKGYLETRKFVENKIFNEHLNLETLVNVDTNFKSKLIEWAQKNKKELCFNTQQSRIDRRSRLPIFASQVQIEHVNMGKGTGNSKKEAEQKAACEALKKIES